MESAEQAARPRKLNVSKSSRAPRLAVFERDFQKLDRDEARPLHLDLLPAMSAGPSWRASCTTSAPSTKTCQGPGADQTGHRLQTSCIACLSMTAPTCLAASSATPRR